MKMLHARKLAVGYNGKEVVSGVDLEALKGQFICLLGPNGAGKSTVLRCLAGLLAPLRGAVYLKGQELRTLRPAELAKSMAVVLTERLSVGLLTAFEVAAMGRYPYTDFWGHLSDRDREIALTALRLVNAEHLAHRYFTELSDGEKQKVMLARALAQEPELIILDEPTTHLDVKHRLEVLAILRRLTREKGITVILSLHEVDLALKVCETAILVKDGQILACGPPEEILKEETVKQLYDITQACFSHCLGGIELKNGGQPQVYVVAGAGSGSALYRLLSKKGLGLATGIIHENDVDFHVARAVGATIISEKPFEEIGTSAFLRATEVMKKIPCVVEADFPVGRLNRRNVELVQKAILQGKPVYSLRSREGARELYGDESSRQVYCRSLEELAQNLSALLGRREARVH